MATISSPLFSVCIPNFNYEKYLQLTCQSVSTQSYKNYEINISDNQSTDGSIKFIREFAHGQKAINININPINLGFAANLEKASSLASGDFMIMLSSDDLMNPGCLDVYAKAIETLGSSKNFVLGSSVFKIDSDGKVFERSQPDRNFWKQEDIDPELTNAIGLTIYRVRGNVMLERCLQYMGNPYYFLTVCFPKVLCDNVGGYAGGRMYNPDKWFNWKLFTKTEFVILIDAPLFSYRWHTQNQVALETSFGHLRYLVDEYRNTIELSDEMLKIGRISRGKAERNFVHRNIFRHGIGEFLKGRWLKSLRIYFFGLATFPVTTIRQKYFIPFTLLLLTTPLGSFVASGVLKLIGKK